MSQKQTWSFPSLKTEEIIACLNELQIPIREEELLNPKYSLVRGVFEQIVDRLTGYTKQDLAQPVFEAIDALEYPELYEDTIAEAEHLQKLISIMRIATVKDFSTADIFFPTHVRFKYILSAVINFAKFREDRLQQYLELKALNDEYIDTKIQMEEELQQVLIALKQVQAQQKAEEPMVQAIQSDCALLAAEIADLNQRQAQLRVDVTDIKQSTLEVTDQIMSTKFHIVNMREECEQLRSQIIHSPGETIALIRELGIKVKAEREKLVELERKSRDMGGVVTTLDRLETDLSECVRHMQKAEVEQGKWKKTEQQVTENEHHASENEAQTADQENSLEHVRRLITAQGEKLKRLQTQRASKESAAKEALKELQDAKDQLQQDIGDTDQLLSGTQEEVSDLDGKMKVLVETHENEMRMIRSQYEALDDQVKAYHESLMGALRSDVAVSAK